MLQAAPWLRLSSMPVEKFGYPKHGGEPVLIDLVRKLVLKLTGKNYKHILITAGCTNAIGAYVHAIKKSDTKVMSSRSLYFPFYPGIAENAGLTLKPGTLGTIPDAVQVIDSPSNPGGLITLEGSGNMLWDAAYYSPTYGVKTEMTPPKTQIPPHIAMAGSLSKFTGINGIRLGWLATDDLALFEAAKKWSTHDTSGISWPSQWLGAQILTNADLDLFWSLSRSVIDDNRNTIQELDHIFGNQPVPSTGMFALFEVDPGIKRLLENAGVVIMPGSACGDTRDSVRINLAQTREATKAMVKDVLKADAKKS